jgi:hypothetical protein
MWHQGKKFHLQKQFLRNTKMQLVHNLSDMGDILTLELKEHVAIASEYLTLRNIIHSFKVGGDPALQSIE